MSIARGPVNRPILTSIIFMIIIAMGVVALSRLAIDLMPEVTFPTISVITNYGNVGPQEMEELVTHPLEEALAAVQGVEEITSTSSEGRSQVRVAFTWGTDLDVAANDIRDRIDRTLSRLPDDIERPMIRKFDLSAMPVILIGISSNMNPRDLRQLVEDQLKYRLERVAGVAAVDIRGGLAREIHINLKSAQLKALGIAPEAIINALRAENRNIPAGLYEKGNLDVLIRTQGEYSSLEEIRQTVITIRDGTPIRIQDVAEVVDSWEEINQTVRINGEAGVIIAINKQSGANTVQVVEAVRAEMVQISNDLPQIRLLPLIDTSIYIKNAINNVKIATIIGGILAIFILFIFLRNISSTIIIATAIPISILATFGLMYFGGFTLNLMTFGGIALGIGMLLDSSIVVLENIFRHREGGFAPEESALVGTSEVWSAIISSTLTTLVVFFPVLFIRGISGIMFFQMAVVVSFALLCALIVALTLVPMLSAHFLHIPAKDAASSKKRLEKLYALSEKAFKGIEERYRKLLDWALEHRKVVIFSVLILFILSLIMIRFIGVELMPSTDEGEVRIDLEMSVGTRLEIIDQASIAIENLVRQKVPEMQSMLTRIGGGGWGSSGGHTGSIRITLVPQSKRKRSSDEIADYLRGELRGIPGLTFRVRTGQGMFFMRMGSSSGDNVSVEVRGYDLQTAHQLAKRVEGVILEVPGITDTRISREEGNPEQVIRVDRQKAADLGLTVTHIGEAMKTAIGGVAASYYREHGKEYRILVRLSEEDRRDLAELLDLTIMNNQGKPVILRNVVEIVQQEGPVRIERKNQERTISITANFSGRDMGSVIADIREGIQDIPVPKDFAIVFGGDYEEQQKAFRELLFGLIMAIFLVYLVMAGQFESFRDPFVVLFSVPMALIGVVLIMILTGTIFSMQAFMGCIMLAGIVVNNAILLVDYTNQLRRKANMALKEAIQTAGVRRLRPILMTTLTTALGLLPLSFGLGEGGETQAPLARVVIGGLLSASLITLILIPVVYSIFEHKLKQKRTPGYITEDTIAPDRIN
ncbi:efflux RND transporter permease subunit [bacterium]|nr:efflux RND transporter permease subunit [bacterium]